MALFLCKSDACPQPGKINDLTPGLILDAGLSWLSNKFIFANLFNYLSFILSARKNIPNSYLKILNEISHYLQPNLGNSNYFLAEIYSNEKHFKIALNKLKWDHDLFSPNH